MMTCKINHSCDPNVFVNYPSTPGQGIRAHICAIKNMNLQEELVQSYIDQSMSYKRRIKALKDYGFTCQCLKCTEER
jgi:hypothetical protein